jgi:hypothetical protein
MQVTPPARFKIVRPVAPAGRSTSKLPSAVVAVCRRMPEFVRSTMSFTCSPPGAGPNASLSILILCTRGSAPHEDDKSEN